MPEAEFENGGSGGLAPQLIEGWAGEDRRLGEEGAELLLYECSDGPGHCEDDFTSTSCCPQLEGQRINASGKGLKETGGPSLQISALWREGDMKFFLRLSAPGSWSGRRWFDFDLGCFWLRAPKKARQKATLGELFPYRWVPTVILDETARQEVARKGSEGRFKLDRIRVLNIPASGELKRVEALREKRRSSFHQLL